jgi:hypothetical protein
VSVQVFGNASTRDVTRRVASDPILQSDYEILGVLRDLGVLRSSQVGGACGGRLVKELRLDRFAPTFLDDYNRL